MAHHALGSVTLTLGGANYRVQGLSSTLWRVEREGPRGFENRTTFLVTNRAWEEVDIAIQKHNTTRATISNGCSGTVLTLKAQPPAPASSCAAPKAGFDATNPQRIANDPARTVATQQACCAACDAETQCTAWVFRRSSGETAEEGNLDPPGVNCWLLSGADGTRASSARVIGFNSRGGPRLHLSIGDVGGGVWFEADLDTVPTAAPLPTPEQLHAAADTSVFAMRDAPRIVPAPWGQTPAPAGAALPNSSGWDLRNDAADVYLFVASPALGGHAALRSQVLKLTGGVPRLPDWAFGLWFTWYHPYSQAEKVAEIDRFMQDDLPLDVTSLDMDWRALPEKDTGYAVNETLFPDMPGFIEYLKKNKKKLFFNDHPMQRGPHLTPDEVRFRYEGLTKMLDLGLDFWCGPRSIETQVVSLAASHARMLLQVVRLPLARQDGPSGGGRRPGDDRLHGVGAVRLPRGAGAVAQGAQRERANADARLLELEPLGQPPDACLVDR